jgi:voltage-gated sodium channel
MNKIKLFLESKAFTQFIVFLILINAVTLGLESNRDLYSEYGTYLTFIDKAILSVFVLELGLKLAIYRLAFFKSGWNIFDFVIVTASLLPASGPLAILRAFRIFRVLRLFSLVPQMRLVVTGLLRSLPGMASVMGMILIIFYISAVLVTKLFGHSGDEDLTALFGSLPQSMLTLFQLMTLENWVDGIMVPAMKVYPLAWMFFIPFIIITSFAILNLFIGVIVEAMQNAHQEEQRQLSSDDPNREVTMTDIQNEVRALREEIRLLRSAEVGQREAAKPKAANNR